MKKTEKKSLTLSRQTLRNLNAAQLAMANGGRMALTPPTGSSASCVQPCDGTATNCHPDD